MQQVGLGQDADKHPRKFSKGMLQRLGLAQALRNNPGVLFLDEPMSGLDPLGRREVRALIEAAPQQGKTVFFSTHILSDIEAFCDRVAILKQGRLLETGKLGDILKTRSRAFELLANQINESALADWRALTSELTLTTNGVQLRLADEAAVAQALAILQRHGGQLVSVNPLRESLEELFVREVSAEP